MQVSSTGIRQMTDYYDALQRYNEAVPFKRGRKKGQRPIGTNRRYHWLTIAMDEETKIIHAELYGTTLVSFTPTGEIHIGLGGYDSVSTRQFIGAVTPWTCYSERGETYLGMASGQFVFADGVTPLVIKDGVVTNPTRERMYSLKRKEMQGLRARYEPFLSYVKNMSLISECITHQDVYVAAETFGIPELYRLSLPRAGSMYSTKVNPRRELIQYLEWVKEAQANDDLRKMHALFVVLGVSALEYSYYHKTYRATIVEGMGTQMTDFIDEILKYVYRDELFSCSDVEVGKRVTNANRKYFNC